MMCHASIIYCLCASKYASQVSLVEAKGRLQMSLREAQLLLLALDAYKSQKVEKLRALV